MRPSGELSVEEDRTVTSAVPKDPEKKVYCSFCGKSQNEVRGLIAGPSVFICDECIALCNDILSDTPVAARMGDYTANTSAIDSLVARAESAVPGQEDAIRTLAAAMIEGLMNMRGPLSDHGGRTVLVVGPTGCGKRQIILELTKALALPHLIVDVPLLYSGATFVESHEFAAFDERDGVILMDHLESVLVPERSEAVRQLQNSLVTIVDSTVLRVAEQTIHRVGTKNALIIGVCDLPLADEPHHLDSAEWLVRVGFTPSLAARFGTVVIFGPPDRAAYESSLTRDKGLFVQYQDSLQCGGRSVRFAADCADPIATSALRRDEGFLGLRTLMGRICRAIVLDPGLGLDETMTIQSQWVEQALTAENGKRSTGVPGET